MSTMVGESESFGMSTIVGESAEGTSELGPGISIRVGESEAGTVPGEELSPLDGVRTAAPPSPGSEGFLSGRPRENSSIRDLGQTVSGKRSRAMISGRDREQKLGEATPGLQTRALTRYPLGAEARELPSI